MEEKTISVEMAQKIIEEQNKKDCEACASEIKKIYETLVADVLKKYNCGMMYEVHGQGTQMRVDQVFYKLK